MRAGPDQGRVVGRAGAQPGAHLDQLRLGDLGKGPVGLAQQLVHAAGGDGGVEATLFDRRPDQQATVLARDHVEAVADDDPLADRRVGVLAQGHDLALDRAHRRPGLGGEPRRLAGEASGRQHQRACAKRAAIGGGDADLVAELGVGHLGALEHRCAARAQRRQQGRAQLPRVRSSLVRGQHPARDRRRQAGLELAAGAGGEPLGLEPVLAVQLVLAAQVLGLVAVERDVQRPDPREARGGAAFALELLGKARPERVRSEVEAQQALLAPRGLAHRGQHPGRDVGRAGAGAIALEHADAETALRCAPGAGEADHAAAGDQDVEPSV